MDARWVAVLLDVIRDHRVEHLRQDARGGRVVQIDGAERYDVVGCCAI